MSFPDMLLMPFQFDFMIYALIASVLIAIPTALLSCFLVLKGWSLMGDAISHAVLPGVVIAYIVGLPFGIGAFVAGMVCALATRFSQGKQPYQAGYCHGYRLLRHVWAGACALCFCTCECAS